MGQPLYSLYGYRNNRSSPEDFCAWGAAQVLPYSRTTKPLVAVEEERPAESMFSRNPFSDEH